ncbi:SDR family NAD(P)-dependent oxidoreductase [Candidatus Macondimonas diazotrophica]|jgi:NAD(P)-dependent dehydrogenase (short-subunit alcohol dehydrogenase family)|uniref:SDR family NAD(P)-dependent oxidoreductase n=1 Tax=Candidatus Macondimonas diazotrophica TaxID=2305248 RepID=A0A4Z0F8J6_9GAMM|nr:SDR family NAD(P)-dependent oxidoreductase [Candidatus Macondimonas diazotrophica]NCU00355.1 SDR family NAD(P)-dependent oxidoreductase [Candidatus Macondimonas diazotrophica]TFZ82683.1 SDR family NAD(P)-dependent oxidoreductase [Candidatus Macondimonas diazotrophica]HBG30240.1 short-chain dehydrogenase [Gammaproteobacteria bacterium]
METVIVTGGSSGIGRALCAALAQRGFAVLAVARRASALQSLVEAFPGVIQAVVADVATPEGRDAVAAALGPDQPLRFLVHNAGTLEPIGPLTDLSVNALRAHFAVNLEAPLFLSQRLLPRLSGGRILHVSSGAAHHAYAGWGPYCMSKAALHMLYQTWREELADRAIRVGSARPGVVDTAMQSLIRSTPAARFPRVDRFERLHRDGQLRRPEDVARFLAWLLLALEDTAFDAAEWDIGECEDRWRAFIQ